MYFYDSTIFDTDLHPGQRFSSGKHRKLRHQLLKEGILKPEQLKQSLPVSSGELLKAHSDVYVNHILEGTIGNEEMRRIGFRWSEYLPQRSLTSVGGSLSAARTALRNGLSGQLAGGSHHAHREFGSGYCIFNDHAVTALQLLDEKVVSRIAVLDLDVHQGDGNASILSFRDDVFVVSIHGEKNFPFRKVPSDLDVGLPDGTKDDEYLLELDEALSAIWVFDPDLILYQAGVDPLRDDRLGRLSLTHAGLAERDRRVLCAAKQRRIPVSMAIGGGYSNPIDSSVTAYVNTYRTAKEIWGW